MVAWWMAETEWVRCLNVFTLQRITMHSRTDMHDSSGTTEGENMLCCTSNAKIKYIHFVKLIYELVADPDWMVYRTCDHVKSVCLWGKCYKGNSQGWNDGKHIFLSPSFPFAYIWDQKHEAAPTLRGFVKAEVFSKWPGGDNYARDRKNS